MMLRRVASARVSAVWRSALRAKTARPCVRRENFAIRALTQRVGDWNLAELTSVKPRLFSSSAASAPAETQAPATVSTANTDEAKEALIAQLRPLCSALYSEHRAATSADALLSQWHAQISSLLQQNSPMEELQRAYEQGVAILFKQREFAFAQDLIQQMQHLHLPLTTAIYQFQIRAVALQWLTQPISLQQLRELPLDNHHWEHALLELVRTEDQPHHRKSAMERQQFHTHLVSGVRDVLAAYEAAVPLEKQEIEPYNEALRVYAANGVPFGTSLRVLNQIPPQSRARATLTVDTFLALLEGARWDDVRHTVERMAKSAVLRRIDSYEERSAVVARVWDQALRAVCNSYSERMMDKQSLGSHQTVKQLQGILEEVEAQLKALLPEQRFATIEQHNAVFELRVKTAAQMGLSRQVQSLLDEYVALAPVEFASGQLGKRVFLKALEIFPSVGLKRVSTMDIERVRGHDDVLQSPEIVELQQKLADVVAAIADKKQQLKTLDKDSQAAKDAGKELRKEHQSVGKLKKKIEDAIAHRALLVAHRHRVEAADRIVDRILARLGTSDEGDDQEEEKKNPLHDLEVAVALMQQFMTTANRFAARMHPQTRELMAEEIMDRVFDLLDVALGDDQVEESDRESVQQLLSLAAKTASMFWREQDLEDVLRLKKKALNTDKLDAEDYDRLVFLRVQKLDIGGAYNLLQEMHFAGVAPTPTAIHRVVTGTLHRLSRPREARPEFGVTMETQNDAMEDEEPIEQAWSNGPRSVEDLPSFIQEWYNLYRVKPLAKTVVPVFARLLAANKIWEVRRLLQILDSMEGGLSPATEYWLERRLEAAGKTIEDLRYKR